jgi:uroporphyrin-III C-methyltransferase
MGLVSGMVAFVGAGPGDPELITLKGWRALQAADVVLYDSLVDRRLVDDLNAELVYVGKRCGSHAMPQEQINRLLAQQARSGRNVARLKGGDPNVLGRVGEELLYLAERDIPYQVIPGVSSATAVPIFAGIPVTMRGVADSFTVVTAHRRQDQPDFSIPPFNASATLVFFNDTPTTESWSEHLLQQGYPEDCPVAFISSGGTEQQVVLVTTVAKAVEAVHAATLISPVLVVVGRVVALRESLRWFEDNGVCKVACAAQRLVGSYAE